MFQELLAKSCPPLPLSVHLAHAYCAARQVLDATQDDQLVALGLPAEEYRDRLRRIVLLAAAVHDLGKANDHFQGMIQNQRDVRVKPQGIRHEWVTVLMLAQWREWLLPAVSGSADDFALVEWAVSGHHPAHDHPSPPKGPPSQGGSGPELGLLTDHPDFLAIQSWLRTEFRLATEAPPIPPRKRSLLGPDSVFVELKRWRRASQQTWERMQKTSDKKLVAAAKTSLIAADVAGSALPKALPEEAQPWDWIAKSFATKPEPGDLRAVIEARSRTFTDTSEDRKRFQEAVAKTTERIAFVKAGCGSGKTLAAYMWAEKNHSTRRLYFCYPTTGTATEGFKDYLFEPDSELGGIGAKLFHSRRDVDSEIILTTGADIPSADAEAAARLESLEAWSTPIVACTVDTVLGLIQNNKRGLFAWPALAQSAFVFDEIHAYDDCLFGALLRFLKDLPALPVLLMTASLPAAREEALRRVVANLPTIAGPDSLESRPRYKKALRACPKSRGR